MASFLPFFVNITLSSLLLILASATTNLDDHRNFLASTSTAPCPTVPPQSAYAFKVLVPNRTYFTELADCSDPNNVRGLSVDVFTSALSILQPELPQRNVTYFCFNLIDRSEGTRYTPAYDQMVNCLSEGHFDAIVGDVTIGAHRLDITSFTQPYSDSGIVILAPMVGQNDRFFVFFKPFTGHMWGSIIGFTVVTACVLWLLEQHSHPEFRQGPLKQRIQKSLWFVGQLMVFLNRDIIKNLLAKAVLVAWIVFIVVLGSAYTASFSAILTVHKLGPDNLNISTLKYSNYRIGYQQGSIVYDYLTRTLGIPEKRLLGLNSTDSYLNALSKGPHKAGGVAVVVDEVPYINLFLSRLPAGNCNYVIVGLKLTNGGFGFAFPRGSAKLSTEFSIAILNLSESGQLQKLQTGARISNYECPTQVQSTRLDLISSEWLFLLLGLMLLSSIAMSFASHTPPSSEGQTLRRKLSAVEPDRDAVHVIDLESSISARDRATAAHDLRKDEIS